MIHTLGAKIIKSDPIDGGILYLGNILALGVEIIPCDPIEDEIPYPR